MKSQCGLTSGVLLNVDSAWSSVGSFGLVRKTLKTFKISSFSYKEVLSREMGASDTQALLPESLELPSAPTASLPHGCVCSALTFSIYCCLSALWLSSRHPGKADTNAARSQDGEAHFPGIRAC